MSAQAHTTQPAPAQSSGSGTGTPNALQGFSQNQGKPIHIDAAKLEVRDKDKVATFTGDSKTGDVKVVQGDTVMRSKTLVVFYEQSGSAAQNDKAAPAASPGPGGSQQIKRLEARGNVIVTQNDQTVTGDTGIFDTRANTVTMQGNQRALRPELESLHWQKTKIPWKGPVVIATNGNQVCALTQLEQEFFDPFPFWSARPRGMYQVAQENNSARV